MHEVAGAGGVEAALETLAASLVGDHDLDTMTRRVTELAVDAIPGCSSASLTLVTDDSIFTSGATDERTLEVDRVQYAVGEGPCLEAYRTGEIQRVEIDEAEERWPAFTAAARKLGLRSYLAAPLLVRGERRGALNLFSRESRGFDAVEEAVVARFAAQAGVTVENVRIYDNAVRLAHQLQEAMDSRAVIEQAKGVLMARERIDSEAAFELLTGISQQRNIKLRLVAAEVVASAR